MDKFIEIDSKDGKGGFIIPDTEDGRDIADELLKNPEYIERKEKKGVKTNNNLTKGER